MTVIVAARTGTDRVTIAADSEVSGDWEKGHVSRPKVWADAGYAFGCAGNLRAAQVLRHHVEWPAYRPDEEPDFERFLIRSVVPAIREGTAYHGIVEVNKGVEKMPALLVIAHGGNVARIEEDYCVLGDRNGRLAAGSGYAEALGSLGIDGPWTERDVVKAAHRAALTAIGVGGPVRVVNTKTLLVREAA